MLRCLDAARATPEVWERVSEQARRPYVDPGHASSDDPEVARLYDVSSFVRSFTNWFRMKNAINDDPIPYGRITQILLLLSRGELNRSDADDIKKHIGTCFLVDDVTTNVRGAGNAND